MSGLGFEYTPVTRPDYGTDSIRSAVLLTDGSTLGYGAVHSRAVLALGNLGAPPDDLNQSQSEAYDKALNGDAELHEHSDDGEEEEWVPEGCRAEGRAAAEALAGKPTDSAQQLQAEFFDRLIDTSAYREFTTKWQACMTTKGLVGHDPLGEWTYAHEEFGSKAEPFLEDRSAFSGLESPPVDNEAWFKSVLARSKDLTKIFAEERAVAEQDGACRQENVEILSPTLETLAAEVLGTPFENS